MKTAKLARQEPKRDLGKKTVVVETGMPKDRLKGWRDDHTMFTGSDARAALVGQYSKKNRKRFKPEKGESMKHERGESRAKESSEDDEY
jgi:hypothetical protein